MDIIMELNHNVTNMDTGQQYGIYNKRVSGGIMDYYAGPFETADECKRFCEDYSEEWHMGYNGRASLSFINGKHYAYCSRWTSCD